MMPVYLVSNNCTPTYTSTTSAVTNCYFTSTASTSSTASSMIWYPDSSIPTSTGDILWADNSNIITRSATSSVYITRLQWHRALYAGPGHIPLQVAAQQREINDHADKAKRRATKLLLSHLTDEQRATFERNKWFIVEGGRTKKRYRIRYAGHLVANIDVMVGDKVDHRLCGHCRAGDLPLADHLLAQKMMLEMAEDEFLKIANRHAA